MLRTADALALEPALQSSGLRGVGYYVDDHLLSPERMCLENVLSALRHGARAHNYCQVEEVLRGADGVIQGVRVRDLLTDGVHTVRASVLINCAGPWVDRLREMAGVTDRTTRVVRTTKGVHCVLPRLTDRAVYLSGEDERMIFLIPWREFLLMGTTDTDFDGDLDRLWATRDEVDYLLEAVRRVVPDPRVSLDHVAYTYARVRPLSWDGSVPASRVSRDHKVVVEGVDGRLLSVTGTKLTCFRSLAEDVGNRAMARFGRTTRSSASRLTLDAPTRKLAASRRGPGWTYPRRWHRHRDPGDRWPGPGGSLGSLRNGQLFHVQGVTVFYPDQNPDDIHPYAWTFHLHGGDNTVENVTLINSYNGIKIGPEPNVRHRIRSVSGCVLRRGIWLDSCSDIGRIENVQWHCHWWSSVKVGGDWEKIYKYMWENCEGFVFAKTDWEYVTNTFIFPANIGYRFIATEHGAMNGQLCGIGADAVNRCIVVDEIQPMGLLITNGQFVAFNGENPIEIVVNPTCSGSVRLQN